MNKIFVFGVMPENNIYYALSDNGKELEHHFCTNDSYAKSDLGVVIDKNPFNIARRETYKKEFPNGYEIEFVNYDDFYSHKELQKAIELSKIIGNENGGVK